MIKEARGMKRFLTLLLLGCLLALMNWFT